jgi:dolichol-phosphate mannosyltransferase
MKGVILIPTYNEAKNIESIVADALLAAPDADIVVIDDSSPDGTAAIAERIAKSEPRVSVLLRGGKEGLGKAYLSGFAHVRGKGYEYVGMMDADHSHDPRHLRAMIESLSSADMVIGSRYCKGGGMDGWELWRVLLSRFANLYCRFITGMPVYDATAGFNLIRAATLQEAPLSSIDASGYAFQIELKHLLWKRGARLAEVPIIFRKRREGESKLSGHIIREAIVAPWHMRLKEW